MRAVVITTCLVLATGCGARETSRGVSTTAADEPPPTSIDDDADDEQRPPTFVLASVGGRQVGVQSTYCITGPTVGTCVDYIEIGPPRRLSVVRPGETVQLVLEDVLTAEGGVSVVRLGCDRQLSSLELAGPTTEWTVDIEPGSYELEVFAVFETAATNGDTSASLGLLVDESATPEVVPAPRRPDCRSG
jgi:hypothetical protein